MRVSDSSRLRDFDLSSEWRRGAVYKRISAGLLRTDYSGTRIEAGGLVRDRERAGSDWD